MIPIDWVLDHAWNNLVSPDLREPSIQQFNRVRVQRNRNGRHMTGNSSAHPFPTACLIHLGFCKVYIVRTPNNKNTVISTVSAIPRKKYMANGPFYHRMGDV